EVTTPLAKDRPAFELPEGQEGGAEPAVAAEDKGRRSSREGDAQYCSSEQVPQYTAHHLPGHRPMGTQHGETGEEEGVESGDQTAAELEPQPQLEHTLNPTASEQEPQHTQNQNQTVTDAEPTKEAGSEDEVREEQVFLADCGLPPSAPSSPVLSALIRAQKKQLTKCEQLVHIGPNNLPQTPGGKRGIPLQRSSSLPSAFLSPSRIVSSVRIQFGRGQASCTKPTYSVKHSHGGGGDEEEDEQEQEEGQNTCLSTLIINPAPSSNSNNQPPRLLTEAPIPPKPIPRHLLRSTCSLHSCSPPPDLSAGDHAHSWSTQSVPSSLGPGHSLHPGLAPHPAPGPGPSQGPSSTEMQLRRVLHDIRGTVQSLGQVRPSQSYLSLSLYVQSLAEFQQKRQSLNLFRSQMTDLEESIIRQQALVYKHLSPVEQLQSLRSAVREELQELEQQLEDRLMELTYHTQRRVYRPRTQCRVYRPRTQCRVYRPRTQCRVYRPRTQCRVYRPRTQCRVYRPRTQCRVYRPRTQCRVYRPRTQCRVYRPRTQCRAYTQRTQCRVYRPRTQCRVYRPRTQCRVYRPRTQCRVYRPRTQCRVYTQRKRNAGYIHKENATQGI
uniref:ITPR interacting domain containing 2 n=1 Tax=Gasterosteus aculeatus aculeatus TaxID=481459 RepID=A0AAQ4QZR6_GASAC